MSSSQSSNVVVSLSQLVDLALGTPEVGTVNFNVLHSVLHIIVQQLNAKELNVEFQGTDASRIENLISKNETNVQVTVSDTSISAPNIFSAQKQAEPVPFETERVRRDEKEETIVENTLTVPKANETHSFPPAFPTANQLERSNSLKSQQTLLVQTVNAPNVAGAHQIDHTFASKEIVKKVESRLEKLELKVRDTFQVPTNTQIIESLKSRSQECMADKSRPIFDIWQTLNLNKRVEAIEATIDKMSGFVEELVRVNSCQNRDETSKNDCDRNVSTVADDENNNEIPDDSEQVCTIRTIANNFDHLQSQFVDFKKLFDEMELENVLLKINEMESNLQEIAECQTSLMESNTADLSTKIEQIENSMSDILDNYKTLCDLNDQNSQKNEELLKEIIHLKTTKANFEDIEDALADKADLIEINRKVSIEKFDQSCDETLKSIDSVCQKLQDFEHLCRNDFDELQLKLLTRPSKSELDALETLIMKRIDELDSKLKSLTATRSETEALGTKYPYLRDLNCISCDNDVFMSKNIKVPLIPKIKPIPITKPHCNVPTFISYKLDSIRKPEPSFNELNLNKFEDALIHAKKDLINRKFANIGRSCGGKHTTTTPMERLTKVGNFLTQWGHNCDTSNDSYIQGADGKMYKAVNLVELNENCQCHHENVECHDDLDEAH